MILLFFNICLRAFSYIYKIPISEAYSVFTKEIERRISKKDFTIFDLCCYFSIVKEKFINSKFLIDYLLKENILDDDDDLFINKINFIKEITSSYNNTIYNNLIYEIIYGEIENIQKDIDFNSKYTVYCFKIYDEKNKKRNLNKRIEGCIDYHKKQDKSYRTKNFPEMENDNNAVIIEILTNKYDNFKKVMIKLRKKIYIAGSIKIKSKKNLKYQLFYHKKMIIQQKIKILL